MTDLKYNEHIKICKFIKNIIDDTNPDDLDSIAINSSKIIKHISDCDHDLIDREVIDAYLKSLTINRALNTKFTSINGMTPKAACKSMYGIWSCMPILHIRGLVGKEKHQINYGMILNFCKDLFDIVIVEKG